MTTGKLLKLLIISSAIASVFGCADGSALITGQMHPPIEDWNSVLVVTEMPDGAEQVAFVKASSRSGLTQQQSLDLAVAELKKQAARIGANVVVLNSRSTGGREDEIVEGIAVLVSDGSPGSWSE